VLVTGIAVSIPNRDFGELQFENLVIGFELLVIVSIPNRDFGELQCVNSLVWDKKLVSIPNRDFGELQSLSLS